MRNSLLQFTLAASSVLAVSFPQQQPPAASPPPDSPPLVDQLRTIYPFAAFQQSQRVRPAQMRPTLADYDVYIGILADEYAATFSPQELEQVTSFLRSSVGQRFLHEPVSTRVWGRYYTAISDPYYQANDMVHLQFEDTPVAQLLPFLMEVTGKAVGIDPEVYDRFITIATEEAIPRSEALTCIFDTLRLNGLSVSESDDAILILPKR